MTRRTRIGTIPLLLAPKVYARCVASLHERAPAAADRLRGGCARAAAPLAGAAGEDSVRRLHDPRGAPEQHGPASRGFRPGHARSGLRAREKPPPGGALG